MLSNEVNSFYLAACIDDHDYSTFFPKYLGILGVAQSFIGFDSLQKSSGISSHTITQLNPQDMCSCNSGALLSDADLYILFAFIYAKGESGLITCSPPSKF